MVSFNDQRRDNTGSFNHDEAISPQYYHWETKSLHKVSKPAASQRELNGNQNQISSEKFKHEEEKQQQSQIYSSMKFLKQNQANMQIKEKLPNEYYKPNEKIPSGHYPTAK